jgi:peptide/nickel transport system ATP-binding protein
VTETVLDVDDLAVSYPGGSGGRVRVVDGVSFTIGRGEIVGLVGESGSGKSSTAMAILGLIKEPGRVERGQVRLGGMDLGRLERAELQRLRWRDLAFIPQGAMNALNPVMRVGEQIGDGIAAHEAGIGRRALRLRVDELLMSVRLDPVVARRYPHQLSGGMRQRVCIAMATALGPSMLIADEPTSALDVVVQRAIAETLLEARARLGASLLLIGHDLALQAQMVDRLAVMRSGRIVEVGPVRQIFRAPVHPYTRALLGAVPVLGSRRNEVIGASPAESDVSIDVADLAAADTDATTGPAMRLVGPDHLVAWPPNGRSATAAAVGSSEPVA